MQPRSFDLALQAVEVACGDRHDRGVEHGRGGALELAGLRIDLVRQRDEGQGYGQRRGNGTLVGWVGVGMQQRNRDALDACRLHPAHGFGDGAGIGHQHCLAGVIDTLGEADAPLCRHLRGAARRQVEAVEMLAAGAADVEHVLEAARRDQRHRFDAILDDGVGDQRRAVHEVGHVPG